MQYVLPDGYRFPCNYLYIIKLYGIITNLYEIFTTLVTGQMLE